MKREPRGWFRFANSKLMAPHDIPFKTGLLHLTVNKTIPPTTWVFSEADRASQGGASFKGPKDVCKLAYRSSSNDVL